MHHGRITAVIAVAATLGATSIMALLTVGRVQAQGLPNVWSSGSGLQQTISTPATKAVSTSYADSDHPCLHAGNHEYEVCTAYVANSSLAVLVPYYKYAHSKNAATVRYVTYRLGSRYQDDAYVTITSRTAGWPAGNNVVSTPTIEIESVTSDLPSNSATLQTREWWLVTDANGRVLYREDGESHTVSMSRVPSYVLHKWVVTDIR